MLTDRDRGLLAALLAAKIRSKRKTVRRFTIRPDQDQAEAATVLAGFRADIRRLQGVLARLADETGDPGAWNEAAASELPDDYGEQEGGT